MTITPARALWTISLAVLLSSSTWFTGTAVTPALVHAWSLDTSQAVWLTTSVQIGFVIGTVLYAALNLADLFNPRRVFLVSALLGAALNAAFGLSPNSLGLALAFRFLTGVTLAGVYPVGMKLVASWFDRRLGWELGVMVGALTLGTASPHLISFVGAGADWRAIVLVASGAAVIGGVLVAFFLPDGPFLRSRARFDARMLFKVFESRPFRYQALGYFGHMWELYAFWSLMTYYLAARLPSWDRHFSLIAFGTIGVGALGCVGGGWISKGLGERRVALGALMVSGLMCLVSGVSFPLPAGFMIVLCSIWGIAVVADSPQMSALAVRYCPAEYTGTALAVQNGLGFGITVVSIQLLPLVADVVGWRWAFAFLAPGPALGAFYLWRLGRLESP